VSVSNTALYLSQRSRLVQDAPSGATCSQAAARAPGGVSCIVSMLDDVRKTWDIGANNFSRVDTAAKARAIRDFPGKHGFLMGRY